MSIRFRSCRRLADWQEGSASMVEVSVVVPCYRCGDTIHRAVRSVFEQTWRPAEVILVDDCGGDDTLETLYALQRRYPEGWVKVIEQPESRGPGEARNAGWDHASHAYIAFLDADDSWHRQKIEIQYRWMREHPETVLTGHGHRQVVEDDKIATESRWETGDVDFHPIGKYRLLLSNCFLTPTVMLRRDVPARFVHGKCYSEDYLLWLKIACAGYPMARCDLPLAFLYKGPYGEGGLSAALWEMEKGELDSYRHVRRSGGISMVAYFGLCVWSWTRFVWRVVFLRAKSW